MKPNIQEFRCISSSAKIFDYSEKCKLVISNLGKSYAPSSLLKVYEGTWMLPLWFLIKDDVKIPYDLESFFINVETNKILDYRNHETENKLKNCNLN